MWFRPESDASLASEDPDFDIFLDDVSDVTDYDDESSPEETEQSTTDGIPPILGPFPLDVIRAVLNEIRRRGGFSALANASSINNLATSNNPRDVSNSAASGSSRPSQTRASRSNNGGNQSSNKTNKRRREREGSEPPDGDGDDGDGQGKRFKLCREETDRGQSRLQLACPFFQHDCKKWNSCRKVGLPTTHRIK